LQELLEAALEYAGCSLNVVVEAAGWKEVPHPAGLLLNFTGQDGK
jgi:hypothetical protein